MAKRYSQPQGKTRIDWSNPITRGLSYAVVNGVEVVSSVTSNLGKVALSPLGVTTAGVAPYKASADVAAYTLIAHHYYTSNNGDYGGNTWGQYTNNGDDQDVGIGLWGGSSQIYAVNRSNGANTTGLENFSAYPYSAIWAMTGTIGSGVDAKAYKNGVFFNVVPQSGTAAFTTDTRKKSSFPGASSSGKGYSFAYKFDRILSDAEIASLSANPWQIFASSSMPLWVASAGGGTNYTLSGVAGSYTTTGNAATLALARNLAASAGSYAVTGNAATLTYRPGSSTVNYTLSGSSGSYAITGNAATFKVAHALSGASGSYALTGNASTFKVTHALSGAAGAYAVTGNAATLVHTGAIAYALSGSAGSYTVTGGNASLGYSDNSRPTKIGGDDVPRPNRFQVQIKNKIHYFDTDGEAQSFMESLQAKAKKIAKKTETPALTPAYVKMMDKISTFTDYEDEEDMEDILMLL